MAIHPDYPGLTVDITVKGQPLSEYVDEDAPVENGQVVTYVEAKSGAEFVIRSRFTEPFPIDKDINSRVYVDGNRTHGLVIRKHRIYKDVHRAERVKQERLQSDWIYKRLRFNDLVISEDEGGDMNEETSKQLAAVGTIKVTFRFGIATRSQNTSNPRKVPILGPVPEEALKGDAKGLQVGLGIQEIDKGRSIYHFDSDGEIFATFIFKYRSRANLEALHIIPRTPSPSPIPETKPNTASIEPPSEPDTLTIEETTVQAPSIYNTAAEPYQSDSQIELHPELSNPTPASTPQPSLPKTSRHSRPQSLATLIGNGKDGLTTEELIVMIAEHRGHDSGLAGKSKKSLLALLKFYEGKDTEVTPTGRETSAASLERTNIKREPTAYEAEEIHIKRESDAIDRKRGNGKRRKVEVIVLDD